MRNLATAIATHSRGKALGHVHGRRQRGRSDDGSGANAQGGTDTGFPQTYPTGTHRPRRSLLERSPPINKAWSARRCAVTRRCRARRFRSHWSRRTNPRPRCGETYVGYAGATDLSEKGSYVRIDGPRIWMEFVVQPAVANPAENHYHALWRDKQADYGGEVGALMNRLARSLLALLGSSLQALGAPRAEFLSAGSTSAPARSSPT